MIQCEESCMEVTAKVRNTWKYVKLLQALYSIVFANIRIDVKSVSHLT